MGWGWGWEGGRSFLPQGVPARSLAWVHPFELADLGSLVTLSAAIANMEVSVSPCAKWPLALHLSLGTPHSFWSSSSLCIKTLGFYL